MPKRSRHSSQLSFFNHALMAPKRRKHGYVIKPELSPNFVNLKPEPDPKSPARLKAAVLTLHVASESSL